MTRSAITRPPAAGLVALDLERRHGFISSPGPSSFLSSGSHTRSAGLWRETSAAGVYNAFTAFTAFTAGARVLDAAPRANTLSRE